MSKWDWDGWSDEFDHYVALVILAVLYMVLIFA